MRKGIVICSVGRAGLFPTTLASMLRAINGNMIISQHMRDAPVVLSNKHSEISYREYLADNGYEEIKGFPPSGRSQKNHNLIMSMNKRRKSNG